MKRHASFLLAAALLAPQLAWAQVQPHRATYSLRLGTAVNAPRIGTAVQEVTFDCADWRIKRDVSVELPLTASFKISVGFRLEGEEARDGNAFRYRAIQIENGVERETQGKVRRKDGKTHVELLTPNGSEQVILPPTTLMPVAAIADLVGRLGAGASSFSLLMLGAEATGAAFWVDVKKVGPDALPAIPGTLKQIDLPAGQSWPLMITVARAGEQDQKPLLSLRAKISQSGVLERLIIDSDTIAVAAYLQGLDLVQAPTCPAR